jgi:hypothetical protein
MRDLVGLTVGTEESFGGGAAKTKETVAKEREAKSVIRTIASVGLE